MKYRKILLAYNGSQEGKRALFECACKRTVERIAVDPEAHRVVRDLTERLRNRS
jgi:hypothetical protein